MSLTDRQIEAYGRQLILQEYSGAAQERLLAARIEITGHGLAAQTAASYLAGAGVGTLYIDPTLHQPGLFAPPNQRSADTVLAAAPATLPLDVLIETDATAAKTNTRYGVLRIEENAAGETCLQQYPTATFPRACPACHPRGRPATSTDPAAAAIAGCLSALVAMRWIVSPAEREEPCFQKLRPGDSTFSRDAERSEKPCNCRPPAKNP